MKNSESATHAALSDARNAASLSERESELLRRSGERIFLLSRKIAAAEREIERLRTELQQANVLVDEVRQSRNVLSAQVTSLLRDREREYDERAELRRLLASLHSLVQGMLSNVLGGDPAGTHRLLGRPSPQRGGRLPMAAPISRSSQD